MKRVLHIIGGLNRAGAETMTMNIYRQIDHSKYQFDFLIYTKDKQDYEDEIINSGGRVIRINNKRGIKSIIEIAKILKKGDYTAIHCATLLNSMFPLLAALLTPNILRICHSHSTNNVMKPSIIKKCYEYIAKLCIRHTSQIKLACGTEAGIYLFGEKFKNNGIVLKNSVDTKIHHPYAKDSVDYSHVINLRNKLNITDELVIGNIARFNEVKNHKFMIDVASRLNKYNFRFKMVLVGTGELVTEIEKLIEEHNLKDYVILTGVQQDTATFFNMFDIFILPSHFEGNPVTLIEAQACGLPSIVSECVTDKIDMGLGLIHKLPIEDANVWAKYVMNNKLKKVRDKYLIKDSLSRNGYNIEITTKLLMDLYNNRRTTNIVY